MSLKNSICAFNAHTLRKTQIEVRNTDGSITVTNKFGEIIGRKDAIEKPEPNFSNCGYIMNPNSDLQVGKVEIDGFLILFGSMDVAQDRTRLQTYGVTHVINLISTFAPNKFPQYFRYLSLVLYDDLEFQLNDSIRQSIEFLTQVRNQKGCCFMHCDAGRSRAPSIVIAYLILAGGYSYDCAFTTVHNARNTCINLNFKQQLKLLADGF